MFISSVAFLNGAKIPVDYTRQAVGGMNISPPISWGDIPAGEKSFALSVVDRHPVARNWVHWLVINIPRGCTGLKKGASRKDMPAGARELRNSFGEIGYGGPQPPAGTGDHPYVFTVYALDIDKLDLPDRTTLQDFMKAIDGHVLGQGSLTGYFAR
ncbi:MAG: YbhB/YbcL family Raf kinase inhibitor-like protein [Desulfobacteraceae bacterium]|nr:YbhB/YbcL family Raf kinase inhibitor-like protein [Desulfobacteraceae bacterium]